MTLAEADAPMLERAAAPQSGKRQLAAGESLALHRDAGAWWIAEGHVELYAAERRDGVRRSPRRYLGRIDGGGMLFGLAAAAADDDVEIQAIAWDGAHLAALSDDELRAMGADPSAQRWLHERVDAWLWQLGDGLARLAPAPTAAADPIPIDGTRTLRPGAALRSERGVLWVRVTAGEVRYFGRESGPPVAVGEIVPLTPGAWLDAGADGAAVAACGTAALLSQPRWRPWLDGYHRQALATMAALTVRETIDEAARLATLGARTAADLDDTVDRFADVLRSGGRALAPPRQHPLIAACQRVLAAIGHPVELPATEAAPTLEGVARAARVRLRPIALRGDWWRQDLGPLVAFVEDGRRPVALLPAPGSGYCLHDGTAGARAVDGAVAAALAPIAHMLYRPLPERSLRPIDLLLFGLDTARRDLVAVLATGCLGGALALLMPLAMAVAFDSLVPGHQRLQLIEVALGLAVVAVVQFAVKATGDLAMLRIEGRIAGHLQAAVIDRILRLPTPIVARYSAADLTLRALVVDSIRRALTGIAVGALINGCFSMVSFVLLFVYAPGPALGAVALTVALGGATVWAGMSQVRALFEGETMSANAFSFVYQLIGNISQLRAAGAEERAFIRWGRNFAELRARLIRSRRPANRFEAFVSGYDVLTTAAVLLLIATQRDGLSTGAFLGFITAFTGFLASALQMARAGLQAFMIGPLYSRARPLLEAVPEVDATKADPGRLTGAIDLNHVVFRYDPNGPPVLNDISFRVAPGEFVALVGASGSGKSTVMKLLLGFEQPEAGGIYVDGQDLRRLDLPAVRRQIGVVLQHGRLLPGTIFENILGPIDGTLEDAWEAARMAGLDADIARMPMGMHTMLTEGSSTLSGGQVQRLLIARAIVGKPRLLLFDEATSALDNRVQAIVSRSLERLAVTRLVIAHRLSTVERADRLLVFDRGRIVQSGSFAELIRQPGPFAELARRQLG